MSFEEFQKKNGEPAFVPGKEYADISKEEIAEKIEDMVYGPAKVVRSMKMYTGTGGMDKFDEAMENQLGYYRVYIGLKVPRILRRIKNIKIKKSVKGIYYRLLKMM